MRTASFAFLLTLLSALPLAAQDDAGPRFELGLTAGDMPRYGGSDLDVRADVSTLGLYLDVYASDAWVISPSVSSFIWADRPHAARLRLDVRRLLRPEAPISPYLFGSGSAFLRRETDFVDGLREAAVGGGAGARWATPWGPALSGEVRYDHWIQANAGQLGVGLRVGIPFGR